ncbi:Ubiquitin-conjugating enzyme E2 5 [Ancistrocladus abbreviatus]
MGHSATIFGLQIHMECSEAAGYSEVETYFSCERCPYSRQVIENRVINWVTGVKGRAGMDWLYGTNTSHFSEYCQKYAKPEDIGAAPEEESSDEDLSEDGYASSDDDEVAGKADP